MSDQRTSYTDEERIKKLPHGGLAFQLGSCASKSCCKSNEEHTVSHDGAGHHAAGHGLPVPAALKPVALRTGKSRC